MLAPADPQWPARFLLECARLQAALGAGTPIEHIGSTSIEGLAAKPYIDMLIGTGSELERAECLRALHGLGYVEEGAHLEHHWLCWPTPGQRVFIVHLVNFDGPIWQARLRFRDRLRESLRLRQAYAALKRDLAEAHADDLDAYTAAKFAFVQQVLLDREGRRARQG